MKKQVVNLFNKVSQRAGLLRRYGDSYDILDVAFLKAAFEAAEFYEENLISAKAFECTLDMIDNAVRLADPTGLFLEFGVASGRTIRKIAEIHQGPVYGFDSFEGLPESWYTGYEAGTFSRPNLPEVPSNVTLVKGWFNETLPDFLERHTESVSFINIDCDLYSSTSFVLTALSSRIAPGCVIQFDELFNYPGWKNHEYKALQEFIAATGRGIRYHSFLRNHQAVCAIVE